MVCYIAIDNCNSCGVMCLISSSKLDRACLQSSSGVPREGECRSTEGLLRPRLDPGTLSLPVHSLVQANRKASLVQGKGKETLPLDGRS